MESRDLNYILPAYVRSYLYYSKNEDPEKIIFPMFPNAPHPYKQGVTIPIEYVPPLEPIAIEITQDGSNVAEVTLAQEAAIDEKDEEIKRLKEELGTLRTVVSEVETPKSVSPAKAAFAKPKQPKVFNVGPDQPPLGRKPKMPASGDIGPGTPLSDMHKRDNRDGKRMRRDLKDEPDIDESEEKEYEKDIKRDEKGNPIIEGG